MQSSWSSGEASQGKHPYAFLSAPGEIAARMLLYLWSRLHCVVVHSLSANLGPACSLPAFVFVMVIALRCSALVQSGFGLLRQELDDYAGQIGGSSTSASAAGQLELGGSICMHFCLLQVNMQLECFCVCGGDCLALSCIRSQSEFEVSLQLACFYLCGGDCIALLCIRSV